MQPKYDILQENEQDPQNLSQEMAQLLEGFLSPLLITLDTLLDKRLIRTFVQCCVAIIRFRNNKQGLWLSELGSYMDGYHGLSTSAPAGTKRLGNLLQSLKWNISHIDTYLLEEADKEVKKLDKEVKKLKEQGKKIYCIWDGSVIEKPESQASEGLGPVISSKAKRLSRSKKGLVFTMPALRPIMVAGMHWTGALIAGLEGVPRVALMSWWTTKGEYATRTRVQEEELLRTCIRKWGDILIHVFDRGYSSGPWIQFLQSLRIHFIIRWKKGHLFLNANGKEMKLWEIGRGKRYLAHTLIHDIFTGEKMSCDIWWAPIWHAMYTYQLYVVTIRVKGKVWYLVTNEPVKIEKQAWGIFFAYRRRWQIETSFRYGKCELAMESPRLWGMESRLKLLSIVTLIYAFSLSLLEPLYSRIVQAILHLKCHRTGKRYQEAAIPLYRLRWAISRLWNDYRPALGSIFPPNLETIQALVSFKAQDRLQKNQR